MSDVILKELAKTILEKVCGSGRWIKDSDIRKAKHITNPLPGLSVGDIVYTYIADDSDLLECEVITVIDGIGYVVINSGGGFGPEFMAVAIDVFGRTALEAAELFKDEIESDIDHEQERIDNVARLKALLGR